MMMMMMMMIKVIVIIIIVIIRKVIIKKMNEKKRYILLSEQHHYYMQFCFECLNEPSYALVNTWQQILGIKKKKSILCLPKGDGSSKTGKLILSRKRRSFSLEITAERGFWYGLIMYFKLSFVHKFIRSHRM